MTQKVILITGASSGIGMQTAFDLQAQNHIVYAAARRLENMKVLQEKGIHCKYLDITNNESIETCVSEIIQEQGRIDVIVNNAGYGSYGAIEDVPIEEARRQLEVNVFGLARITQLILPYMRNQKSGTIINISSVAGKTYMPLGGWYHASKYALEGLSDTLRLEVKQFGIKVVIIEPGFVGTEWDTIAFQSAQDMSGKTPYNRMVKGIIGMFTVFKNPAKPIVISRLIQKAIKSKRPKTRYIAGTGAYPILISKALLPDKWYDAMWHLILKFGYRKQQKIDNNK